MANLQTQFVKFHEAIKLKEMDENSELREKRNGILDSLRKGIEGECKQRRLDVVTFDWFDQGSYAMRTGVKPLDNEYDIDVGLRFHVSKDDWQPVALKELVMASLARAYTNVSILRPCVRVDFKGDYHVDLAIYASRESNSKQDYLAKGYSGSASERKIWEKSDAEDFIKHIKNRWQGDDGQQFRRVIRYLKRWKDCAFKATGNSAPVGIGLTISADDHFQPVLGMDGKAKDLEALLNVVDRMLASFRGVYHEGELALRISGTMPVEPFDDVYSRISNKQMESFRVKLESLRDALVKARWEECPNEAATLLSKHFGDDFPIPPKNATAQKSSSAPIVTGSASA